MKIDETDLKIIDLLKENGRIQNNEIASRLSISEGTVRNRIKKLIDNKFLSIRGLVNPEQIQNKQIILIGARVSDSKKMEKAAQYMANLKDVIAVYMVTGSFDLFVEVFIEPQNLLNFLSIDLAKIDDMILNTESFIIMKSYKKWI
jgi:Lrp/AsnC family transcriptional regulator for asnA, asnC and gidA